LQQNDQTVNVVISLLGLSQEEFFRHVTLARLEKRKDITFSQKGFSEWKLERIIREMLGDREFADAVFGLLLNGINDADLRRRIPQFLLAKLDGRRLATVGQGGIDALIRSGLKGSYDAKKGDPVVKELAKVLDGAHVKYLIGELRIPRISRQFD